MVQSRDLKRSKVDGAEQQQAPQPTDAADIDISEELADLFEDPEDSSDTAHADTGKPFCSHSHEHKGPAQRLNIVSKSRRSILRADILFITDRIHKELKDSKQPDKAIPRRHTIMNDCGERKSMAVSRKSMMPIASDRKSMFSLEEPTNNLALTTTIDLLEVCFLCKTSVFVFAGLRRFCSNVLVPLCPMHCPFAS